ncbi:uncharacterized protein [Apostichopus japonicus]|uniref:uncharacterized protein n=1 Tax=Stichopus japonicus TaxID=307972 RepID=UPI003AB5B330
MIPLSRMEHICLLFLFTIFLVHADVEFPKDQRTDHHEFPPKVPRRKDKLIPVGHLRPFGFQKKPEGPVIEYKEALHPKKFWQDHVSKKLPCVYRGDMSDSPAMKKWTDEYMNENYGDLDVLVEVKKEDRTIRPKKMSLSTFLKGYLKEDWYIVSVLPDEMRGEVKASKSLHCGSFTKTIQETNLWMSSGETASLIHFDADHNLHCLLSGRKDFVMIDPMYSEELYMARYDPNTGSGYSKVDVDMINMFQHGEVAKAKWTWATLRPGDCIYIPAGHIHQVRSYGRSISATSLFTTYPEFDDSDCKDKTFSYTSMKEMNVMWTYKKGDKVIEIGYMNVDTLRQNLLVLLGDREHLRIEVFAPYFNHLKYDIDPEEGEQYGVTEEVKDIFYEFDIDEKDYLTKEEIENLTLEQLKEFARRVDLPTVPPEQPNYEYKEEEEEEIEDVKEEAEDKEGVTQVKEDEEEKQDEQVDEDKEKADTKAEDKEEEQEEAQEEPKVHGHGHDHHDHDEL